MSFIGIVLVIYIHSYNINKDVATPPISSLGFVNAYVQNFIANGLCRTAVPLFFLFSGFLFFLKYDFTLEGVLSKYKSRVKSLVYPYILWSFWGILVFYILQQLPYVKHFFTGHHIADYNISQLLFILFLDPFTYPLWFIRDLIFIVAATPLIYLLLKNKWVSMVFVAAVFGLWFFDVRFIAVRKDIEAVFYFVFGAFCAMDRRLDNISFKKYGTVAVFGWVLICTLYTFFNVTQKDSIILNLILLKSDMILGLISIWYLYDCVFQKKNIQDVQESKVFKWSNFTFFIFLFHEPLLTILKKVSFAVAGKSGMAALAIYLFLPLFILVASLIVGTFLNKNLPKLYAFAVGGRSAS
ncbi:acyltransferase family protein [Mucilaginibacter sp. SP1R1]|uniref:acyltransferase family protein n=1 Tax=Mucilaginibacter sp. SP1R1 TaxID=2723091 RepID=UPI0016094965|nr:acyltransferase [Mucilaginibacter sp. SP1R1]MBB6152610.1 surface polysaccharide O-acyltransferase-like enzyme [Mucilaginibacter sp. SP1R1]